MKFRNTIIGEKILLIGFFLTPFTSLRFGIVGVGEVLVGISALIAFYSSGFAIRIDPKLKNFIFFWVNFLILSLVGFYYNFFFNDDSSGRAGTTLFDLFSYIFILIAALTTGHFSRVNPKFAGNFFKTLFMCWAFAYLLLYIMSFFVGSIFGFPLRYYDFFAPLVDNVHQAASLTCAMTFVMLHMAKDSSIFFKKVFYIFCSLGFGLMAIDSGSTKALLGVVCGSFVGLLFFIGYRSSGKAKQALNSISLIVIVLSSFFIMFRFSDYFLNLGFDFFTENDGGGAREVLYSSGFEHGLKSFLVGYGPGSHSPYEDGYSDAHNTILTIFLQSGVLGVFVFLWFIVRLLRDLSIDFALVASMSAVCMYIIGGDVLRRLPIWLVLIGLVYFACSRSAQFSKSSHGK